MTTDNTEYEYNPIKDLVGGKEAERVEWSTKSIMKAVEGLKKGLPLKANPFIGKNVLLLKPNLVYKRTPEEVEDYIRCKNDPVYFGSKCYLKTTEGLQKCELREYQVKYLNHLQEHDYSIFLACRQCGKSVTTAIDCLHTILFNVDKYGLILSKSGPAGEDLLRKIKDMYMYLPYHLKIGTMKWNQKEISFDNNSNIKTVPFGPTAGVGDTINFLILDEFAWMPAEDVDLFYENVIPTISSISDAKVCIMSTQNGFNKFYQIWKGAIEKKNAYAPYKVDWWQVPQYNKKTKTWFKRDEAWKEAMVAKLNSEESFFKQFGTQFSASDKCLVSRECLSKLRDIANDLFENNDDLGVFLKHPECLFCKPGYDFEKLKSKNYLVTVDLAEGGGADYTVFNIFEVLGKDSFEQIGYWRSNKVDLESASLDFWLMWCQLFNNDRCIFSIEWNTYGALFFKCIKDFNEQDYDLENKWRWDYAAPLWNESKQHDESPMPMYNGVEEYYDVNDGVLLDCVIKYKKETTEDSIANSKHTSKFVPGIKFSSSNKKTACSMLKLMFEKKEVTTTDLITVGELENFEDKNGNGSYAASYGHDDIIMTFCQLPMVMQTIKYKSLIEDMEAAATNASIESKWPTWNDDSFGNFLDNSLRSQKKLEYQEMLNRALRS